MPRPFALVFASLLACGAPSPVRTPQSGKHALDEPTFCRIFERAADAIGVDLRATAGRTDLSAADARRALAATTLVGARPRVADIASSEGLTDGEVAAFVDSNREAAERCYARFDARLTEYRDARGRVMALAGAEAPPKEPFPWRADVETARAEARAAGRPLVIVFCSSLVAACDRLDRKTFADDRLRTLLSERFVAARADMTDNDDAATKRAKTEFRIERLPVIVVLDAEGREAARVTEWIDAEGLRGMLEKVR
jgi:hypothetical protein